VRKDLYLSMKKFLETASEDELLTKKNAVQHLLETELTEEGVIRDARRIIKMIEEEILARQI